MAADDGLRGATECASGVPATADRGGPPAHRAEDDQRQDRHQRGDTRVSNTAISDYYGQQVNIVQEMINGKITTKEEILEWVTQLFQTTMANRSTSEVMSWDTEVSTTAILDHYGQLVYFGGYQLKLVNFLGESFNSIYTLINKLYNSKKLWAFLDLL